ncbi:MAG: alpha/beta fold hydrolase [Segetibacter sp.]
MRKHALVFSMLIISLSAVCQRPVKGDWMGTLNIGVKVRLVLHIKNDSAGSYTATMDSPDQGAKGLPVSSLSVRGDSLHVEVNVIKGNYEGLFINDTTVTGSWSQGPTKLALTLVKTNKTIALNRPQTPKPPFNYKSDDVEYDNADKSVHFAGTFTYPNSDGPFPAAILITGSGQQDRDETLFEHKPFAVIADYLTKKGFAILRVDDRGMGKTTGEVQNATSEDFAKDVEAGLSYLKSRKETDTSRLGLIGHSEGGLIAEFAASRRKDINFVVLLAGPGIKGSVLLADQGAAILEAEGYSSAVTNSYKPFYLQVINTSITEKDTLVAFKKVWAAFESWKKTTPETTRNQLGFTDDTTAKALLKNLVTTFSLPWMRYFLNNDPQKLIEKINAKVLALNGEKDVQVLAKPNLAGIKVALQKSKSKVSDIEMLPGLNHLFQKCIKCSVSEYGQLEETINPTALTAIGDWLKKM